MKSLVKALAAALVSTAMAAVPAVAQTVTIDYDHSVNFLKFKTYTWEKVHATDPGVEGRITSSVNRDIAARNTGAWLDAVYAWYAVRFQGYSRSKSLHESLKT